MERLRDHDDREAFGVLVSRYKGPLFAYIYRFLGDSAAAEDCFQESFLRIYRARGKFNGRFRPFLYKVAANLCIDMKRKKREKLTDRGEVEAAAPAGEASKEAASSARRAVAALPPDVRTVVLLAYFEGLTLREIADLLGAPLGTVKSRLNRGLGLLRKELRD